MNYKRMSLRAMMLALVVVLFAGFASCSKSDDDNNASKVNEFTPIGTAIVFTCPATEDELALCDITAEYTDENGKTQTETITTTNWKKQITYSSLSGKGSISVKHKLKANVELTKNSYKFYRHALGYLTYILYSNNYSTDLIQAGSLTHKVSKDNVEKEINEHKFDYSYTYTFDKNKNSSGNYFTVTEN